MQDTGKLMAALGIAGFLFAMFVMPTSVDMGLLGERVVNAGLQQRQMLAAIGSAALFLAGCVLRAGGAIVSAIIAAARPATAPEHDRAMMERLGIDPVGADYRYDGFLYGRLSDAVQAAERKAADQPSA